MYVTQQSILQAASDLNANRDAVLQGAGPDAGRTYTIHKSTKMNFGTGTDTEMTTDVLGGDGLLNFAHNVSNGVLVGPQIYDEKVSVNSGDGKFEKSFQVWKETRPVVSDPVHAALIFILEHLANTATDHTGTIHVRAGLLRDGLMDKFYPLSDAKPSGEEWKWGQPAKAGVGQRPAGIQPSTTGIQSSTTTVIPNRQ